LKVFNFSSNGMLVGMSIFKGVVIVVLYFGGR